MTFFASHMTNLMEIILPFRAYGTYDIFYVTYDNFVYVLFITLRAYDIFCIAYDKFDGNNFIVSRMWRI